MSNPAWVVDAASSVGLFPTSERLQLLHAALGEEQEKARECYARWRSGLDPAAPFDADVLPLLPLLCVRLRALGIADELTARLQAVHELSALRTRRLLEGVRSLVAGFREAGLELLAVKGAPLAFLYYADPALRPMSDIDFVVDEREVPRAREVLHAQGFDSPRALDADTLRFRHAMRFTDRERNQLDLHWHVALEFCDDGADRWFRHGARPVALLGHSLRAPDATRMLLQTLLRGVRWRVQPSIRWIADAVLILRRDAERIDWRALVGFAEQRAISHRIGLALGWLNAHFDLDVPPQTIERLANRRLALVERLENRVVLRDRRAGRMGQLDDLLEELMPFVRHSHDRVAFGFCGELLRYLRHAWELEHRGQIPGYLLRRILRGEQRRAVDAYGAIG